MASSPAGVSYSLLGQTSLGAVFMPVNAKGGATTVPAHPGTNSGQRASLLINTPEGFKPITAKADTKRAFHELGLARQDLRGKNAGLIADGTAALAELRAKVATSPREGTLAFLDHPKEHLGFAQSGIKVHSPKEFAAMLADAKAILKWTVATLNPEGLKQAAKLETMISAFSLYAGKPIPTQWLEQMHKQADLARAAMDAVAKFSSLEAGLLTDIKNLDVAGADAKIPELLAAAQALKLSSLLYGSVESFRQNIFVVMASKLEGASFERRNEVLDQLEAKFYAHGNAMPTEMRRYFDSLRVMHFQDAVPFMWRSLLTGTAFATALVFVGAEAVGVFGLATAWANVMSWGAEIYVPNSRHVPHGSKLSDVSMGLSFASATTLLLMTTLGGWSDYPVLTALATSVAVYGSTMRYGASALSRSVLGQQPAAK